MKVLMKNYLLLISKYIIRLIFFLFLHSHCSLSLCNRKNHRPTANNGFHSLYYICTHITLSRHCSILAMNATTNSYVPAVSY